MRKIITIFVILCLLGSSAFLVGCNPKKSNSGTTVSDMTSQTDEPGTLPESGGMPGTSPEKTRTATSKNKTSQTQAHKVTILETFMFATRGKLANSGPFKLGSKREDILRNWKNPKKTTYHSLERLTYDKKYLAFTIEHGKVKIIESSAPELRELTLSEVKNVLGKPQTEGKSNPKQYLVVYEAGNNWLSFIFSASTKKVVNVSVDQLEETGEPIKG